MLSRVRNRIVQDETLPIGAKRKKRREQVVASQTFVHALNGKPAVLQTGVTAQIAYLKKADAIVTKYLASLGARKAELENDKAGEHYKRLQAEFEKAFPDYQLSCLIQYGIYGLVNSKL